MILNDLPLLAWEKSLWSHHSHMISSKAFDVSQSVNWYLCLTTGEEPQVLSTADRSHLPTELPLQWADRSFLPSAQRGVARRGVCAFPASVPVVPGQDFRLGGGVAVCCAPHPHWSCEYALTMSWMIKTSTRGLHNFTFQQRKAKLTEFSWAMLGFSLYIFQLAIVCFNLFEQWLVISSIFIPLLFCSTFFYYKLFIQNNIYLWRTFHNTKTWKTMSSTAV